VSVTVGVPVPVEFRNESAPPTPVILPEKVLLLPSVSIVADPVREIALVKRTDDAVCNVPFPIARVVLEAPRDVVLLIASVPEWIVVEPV
jgi:hypothetical protein